MKRKPRMWSILLCCGLLLSGTPQIASAEDVQEGGLTISDETPGTEAGDGEGGGEEARFLQELAAGGSVTVSTPEQFEQAMNNNSVTEIIVTKRITLCGTAESEDYSISPVMIRGGVTIKGNGSGILTLRSPIQLTGDNVTFQNIEMNFISSGALGSVPHREIFLAGHTLTLDNVSCYTKGSDGSLGGFGGDEAELLPTVYAGGYRNTAVRANGAGLTVQNSNDKTNIQAIYAGHDGGEDNKVPYTGTMNLQIDSRAAVRDGIFASANEAEVNVTVTGQNINSCKTKYFEGNKNTTITFDNISVNRIPVNGGNIVLTNGAVFEPVAKEQAVIDSIDVQQGTTLNLASMLGTVINGDFKGGGTLILDKDDSLTIHGAVSGDTTFQTWGGSLAGIGGLTDGKAYITCTSNKVSGTITLDGGYSNYSLDEKDGIWTAKNNTPVDDREFGSFEVLSAPEFVDFAVVEQESLNQQIKPSQIFVTETKDVNGDVYVPEYGFDAYVLRAEDVDKTDKTDWGTDIDVMELGNWQGNGVFEGKYYISFGTNDGSVSSKIVPGEYEVFFTKSAHDGDDVAVGDIVGDAVGSAEFTIYKNQGQASTEITEKHVGDVPEQSYTGKEIKPSVQVIVDGTTLTEGKDYILKYENNKNVTSDSSMAKVTVEGIGEYRGSVAREFRITKGETETKSALTAEEKDYTYGEIVKFHFTAEPKKESGKKRAARSAQANTADFYCGDTLLGSADVVNGKATLLYDTTKRQVPVGAADITVDFGGNAQLKAANFTEKGLFHLQKRKLEQADVASISLNDFVYDGSTTETEITGITWKDSTIQNPDFEGKAQLLTSTAGSYQNADIISLNLIGEDADWYEVTGLSGSYVSVNPAVVIKKAESEGTLFKTLIYNDDETAGSITFDETIIPEGFELDAAELGDTAEYGQLLKNVQVTNTEVTFELSNAITEGGGTIHVNLTFKNHADVHLELKVIKTSRQIVTPKFQISDMEYTGLGYDGWSVEGYSKDEITATYYDLDEEKDLGSSAPTEAGNYSVTLRLDTGTEIAEETVKFTIEKRQTVLKALDRRIKVGEAAPNLAAPIEGTDYEFASGKPNEGESIGVIKMVYAETPNTSQAGTYEIQIGIVGDVNRNYSVETQNAQLEVVKDETPEPPEKPEEYRITVTGGKASASEAKAGDVVTITAEEPEGQHFVSWKTASEGVVFENAERAETTFVMPANDVEVTAEFAADETPKPPEKPEEYRITVTGGKASASEAKAGDVVTITAEEPEGQHFVSWKTASEGVVFENAERAETTFVMPANDVEITAEFAADETPKPPEQPENPGTPGTPGTPENPETPEKPEQPETPGSQNSSGSADSNHGNGGKTDKKPNDKTTGEKQSSATPTTGDNSPLVTTGIILLISLAAIAALLFFRRRR